MRCNTREASDTILGGGLAALGFNAADVPIATRGVGWLHADGDTPVKVRSYYLSDDEIRDIAARGAALRGDTA